MMSTCYIAAVTLLVFISVATAQPNVLFLIADDLRPEIPAFQTQSTPWLNPDIQTPNLNNLASKSLVLRQTYTQYALCNPSRSSLMTSRRPDTTKVYTNREYWRISGGNFTTLPQYFKENGYFTTSIGKIYHPGSSAGIGDPMSWSEDAFFSNDSMEGPDSWRTVPAWERELTPLPDDQITYQALQTLDRLAEQDQPFFLAVGFMKPHLPFVVPEEYLELYPSEDIYLPNSRYVPENMPDIAWNDFNELRKYDDIEEIEGLGIINVTMPDSKTLELRRGYYAAITYMDNMLGLVLQKVEQLGLAGNTIISFYGDHGFQLGDNCEWTKITNFEVSAHVPLMIHLPGITTEGIISDQLAELVDIYPTIVEAAGLPQLEICPEDSSDVILCREGDSLLPLITGENVEWKDAAFSQSVRGPESTPDTVGYSIKMGGYRYTEWPRWVDGKPDWNELAGVELYDYEIDPEGNYNYAGHPEYMELGQQLSDRLRKGWKPVEV